MKIPEIAFPQGDYVLNPDPNFNFQFNRVVQWDGGRLEDVVPVSGNIHTGAEWKRQLIALGYAAFKEGRIENAIAYSG